MRYKFVAIDMDGTLLNSQNEVSLRNRQAIDRAREKGVQIVLSTGRILESAKIFADELQLNTPILACNGAIILDENRNVIYNRPLELDLARRVMELGRKHNIYYHFYNEEFLFSNQYIKEIVDYYSSKSKRVDCKLFNDDEEMLTNKDLNIFKFLFIDDDLDKLNNLRLEIGSIDGLNVSKSWVNNLEVMDFRASKGIGLQYLCNEMKITQNQVIAIGDSENDLSMINYAGFGVAMGNGDERVKLASDYITGTNDEDGVAKVIEKFVLGDEI